MPIQLSITVLCGNKMKRGTLREFFDREFFDREQKNIIGGGLGDEFNKLRIWPRERILKLKPKCCRAQIITLIQSFPKLQNFSLYKISQRPIFHILTIYFDFFSVFREFCEGKMKNLTRLQKQLKISVGCRLKWPEKIWSYFKGFISNSA